MLPQSGTAPKTRAGGKPKRESGSDVWMGVKEALVGGSIRMDAETVAAQQPGAGGLKDVGFLTQIEGIVGDAAISCQLTRDCEFGEGSLVVERVGASIPA